MAPVRGPPGSFAPVPTVRAAELASLRQSSPPNRVRDRGKAPPAGAMRWRDKIARSFVPRPLGPLLCSGRISCGLPSHGAFRFLAASSGGMRCRPYNCTTTLDSCFRRNDRKRNDRGAAPPAGARSWRRYNYEILHFVQNDSEGKTARGVGTRAGASRFLQINGSTSSTPQASKSRRFRVASCKP